ncbi:MAG: DUF6056 family protein [Butyrivibrio sp.]|jgi:hypothetical protein|nr:DUF6056 family protein [Butyrivibrio sp.]
MEEREMKKRRILFETAVAICFITILIYNFLTPMLSDDLNYATVVRQASGIGDLFRQEYRQYMTWTGRSPSHLVLRLFLFGGSKAAFNVFDSVCFTLLTLCMYLNLDHRKKYDVRAYTLLTLSVWIFGVSFAETVLWETGACNYLVAATVILGYMTLFRRYVQKADAGGIFRKIGMLLLGIWAGWCNENTSGGAILFVLLMMFFIWKDAGRSKSALHGWMFAGLSGNILGFAMMILAPGNAVRSGYKEELHSGLLGLASRWLKITLNIREQFFVLLCIFVFLTVLLYCQKAQLKIMRNMFIFFLLFGATCYAMVLAPESQVRSLFGAGIFLIIACVQGYVDVQENDALVRAGKLTAVWVLLLYMFFSYIGNGASLARIYREENERYEYLEQQAAAGVSEVTIPELRPQFHTKYSMAYASDVKADKEYWVNGAYAGYYGFDWVYGVPRDEWTQY